MQANYIDVTDEWLKNARPNSHKVREMNYFEINGIVYKNDNVKLDFGKREKKCANWFENTFGGEIFLVPRIVKPVGISTPDFLINDERWDLKCVKSNGNRAIDNRIHGTKQQTSNYIIDVTENLLSDKNIINQVRRVYSSPERRWVNKIMVKRNDKLIAIFIRK